MDEEGEITELFKGLTIRIGDEIEYKITNEQAKELAYKFFIQEKRKNEKK